MSEAIVITPVKDSPETTARTIDAVCRSESDIEYFVYNDFSQPATREILAKLAKKYSFQLAHIEDITQNPSPNYKLVLQLAQQTAIEKKLPLIIVESDVVVQPGTIKKLLNIEKSFPSPGLVGAITVDMEGNYNFPYHFAKTKSDQTVDTSRSLSFCCTLLSLPFLEKFSFEKLDSKKDWFDVTISRQAKKEGFRNYLAKGIEVLHLPHSSRPWKNLKYSNPLLYYSKKLLHNRDKI
ncbi:MAG TPA: glycosyltransferase [Mariniphaga anaerophila]|uniref:Glycosyltransferase n=1 Tax=Mariniphaga anaerophila TaxID=1484053 RepID=A0A831PPH6_9BACT|nr:glycosyltransferase [Mariniphaga anaerophila]